MAVEQRAELSKSKTGKVLHDEIKLKRRIRMKERRHKPHNFGVPMSAEQREVLRKANTGKKLEVSTKDKISTSLIGNKRRAKSVRQLDEGGIFIKEFESVESAAKQLNTSAGNIHFCLSGTTNTAKGFKWEYSE